MRCGGQRACNPLSSQRQFEYRFSANAALADRPGISAIVQVFGRRRPGMALHMLAYNLMRVLNIVGVKPLMAAMQG